MILEQLDFWHWWVLGIVLIILELFAPGAFFLWMGIAAGLVGLILVIAPGMAWQYQLIVFAAVSVVSIVVWRSYLSRHPTQTDRPALNMRGEQYVGRVFTLSEPIVNGSGKIKVDDSMWKIEGEDCNAGAKVKVTRTEGAVLKVEIVDK
ncbi:MAG: NfeD family protein [Gammaproteobacteria bacterium]|nr:NfeD family protein [Gammaproteobacteria bacterium]